MADLRELNRLNKRYWMRLRSLHRELADDPGNEVKKRELAMARALYMRTAAAIQDAATGRPQAASPWCHCGNISGKMDFYEDGQHPEMKTHHWRCGDCGGLTQVG